MREQDLRVIGPYCLSMAMAGKKKQEIEQVEVAKATNSAVYAVVVALGLGAVQQFFVPLKDLVPASAYPFYRFAMLGLLSACVAFVFVRAWLTASDKSHELHHRYAAFRSSIVEDSAEHFYARGIRGALVRVDRFFEGDGARGAVVQQTAFGMQAPAPLWTAQSYDRCLMLALFYPIAVIFCTWTWSGHIGPAEFALGLPRAEHASRIIVSLAMIGTICGLHSFIKLGGIKTWLGLALAMLSLQVLKMEAGANAAFVAAAISGAIAVAVTGSVAVSGAAAVAVAVGISGVDPGSADIAAALTAVLIIVGISSSLARICSHMAMFQIIFSLVIFVVGFLASRYFPNNPVAQDSLALCYFLVILTLVNAPFDWLALGTTRGLLRLGLERGGAWPLMFGLVDLALSIALLLVLAIAMLWTTELFNHMAALGGLKAPVDPARLVPALAAAPFAPEHIWLIAMLFSTQIPALLNLMFGTFCLLRGLPVWNRALARDLPDKGEIPFWRSLKLAFGWSTQLGLAVFFGLVAFYLLFFDGLVWLLDAVFGTTLIGILKSVSIAGWLAG